jgi:multiple sugar transport system substrate-binding protein
MKRFSIFMLFLALAVCISLSLAQEPVTINMSTWAGVGEAAELQVILDEINASQSEYQIVHQPIPSDYYTQVQTQIAGGVGADLYWIDQDNMSLAADGVFLPIDDCVADAAPQTAGDLSDYYPGILQIAQFEGATYGLPWISAPVVVFYNRGLFDAAGLEYPTGDWTWNDFMSMAEALTLDTDGDGAIDQWGFSANGWPPPHIFIWQAGGDVMSEDFSESPIDSAEAIEGVEFYLNLAYNPAVAPSRDVIAEQGFGEMFKAGKVALFMGGAADDLDRVEGLDVGVVTVPHHPVTGDNTTFAWSATTVINANTANPELACEALLAVTEGIQNWKIVSPRISHATVEHLVSSEPRKEASAEAIIAASQNMRAFQIFGDFQEWNGVFWGEYMNPLLNGETDLSPAELAAEVRLDLEDTLPESD